jgi:hypothetical protein
VNIFRFAVRRKKADGKQRELEVNLSKSVMRFPKKKSRKVIWFKDIQKILKSKTKNNKVTVVTEGESEEKKKHIYFFENVEQRERFWEVAWIGRRGVVSIPSFMKVYTSQQTTIHHSITHYIYTTLSHPSL